MYHILNVLHTILHSGHKFWHLPDKYIQKSDPLNEKEHYKTAKEKINNLLKSFSIKQLYFAAVLPLLILGYILIAFSVWNVYLHQMKIRLPWKPKMPLWTKPIILTVILIPFIMQPTPSSIQILPNSSFKRTLLPHLRMISHSWPIFYTTICIILPLPML